MRPIHVSVEPPLVRSTVARWSAVGYAPYELRHQTPNHPIKAADRSSMFEHPITAAFTQASTVLRFAFEPHFAVALEDGAVVQSLGLVRHFGSKIGALLFSQAHEPVSRALEQVKAKGYYYSILFGSYHSFDRQHFEDTLNDWGFYGPEETQPLWYTGTPWTR